jgi:dihydroxyacid dehydratase/phosphogluconate dehydratase
MAALPGQLDLLTAEAVAAAVVLGARIAVSTASPHLAAAADSVDVIVDVVALD